MTGSAHGITTIRYGLLALVMTALPVLGLLAAPPIAAAAGEFTLLKSKVSYRQPRITPDNKMVVALAPDELSLTVYDMATGATVKTFTPGSRIYSFAVTPTNDSAFKKCLAIGGLGFLRIYSYPELALVKEYTFPVERGEEYGGAVFGQAFSENSNTLVYSYGERTHGGLLFNRNDHTSSKLVFVNLDDGSIKSEIASVPVTNRLVWSSEDDFVAGIFNPYYVMQLPGNRAQVRVFKPANGHEVVNPKEIYGVSFVDFAPTDTQLVTASPRAGIIEIYSMLYQKRMHSIKYRWGSMFEKPCFAVSHGGRFLAMAGTWHNNKEGTPILIYNLQSGALVGKLHEAGNVTALTFSPNDRMLLASEEQGSTLISFAKYLEKVDADVFSLDAKVEADPTLENRRERAMLNLDKGYYLAAKRDLNEIIKQSPQDGDAYNKRAMANDNLYNYDEALADYTKAMELTGKTPALQALRSMVYFAMNNRDKALDDIDHAILYDPGNITYVLTRGMYYHDLEWADLTISNMKAVVAKKPDSAQAWYLLGDGYFQKRELDTALKHYDKAIALDPRLASAYRMRAAIYGNKNKVEQCLANANKYIALAEQQGEISTDVYLRRAAAYKIKGDPASAERDYATADRYGDSDGYLNLIASHLSGGDDVTPERLNALHEVVALAPDNKEAKEWLARAELMKAEAESWAKPMAGRDWGGYDDVVSGYSGSPGTYSSPSPSPSHGYGYSSSPTSSSSSTYASRRSDYYERQAAQRSAAQDRANYRQIEQKFWNMNNPYNRR